MKWLVIGSESLIGQELYRLKKMQLPAVEWNPVDWQDPAQTAGSLFARHQPCYVLSLLSEYELSSADRPAYLAFIRELAIACREHRSQMIFISDNQVFDGIKSSAYSEQDAFSPLNDYGKWLVRVEKALHKELQELIILRVSWLYSARADSFLTRLLAYIERGEALVFDSVVQACPTSAADVARVVVAIIQQLDCGAVCWGAYHYCSSDVTSGYRFAEAVIAIAGQYNASLAGSEIAISEKPCCNHPSLLIAPGLLSCQKILDSFGIKQRPWRSGLGDIVKQYYTDTLENVDREKL